MSFFTNCKNKIDLYKKAWNVVLERDRDFISEVKGVVMWIVIITLIVGWYWFCTFGYDMFVCQYDKDPFAIKFKIIKDGKGNFTFDDFCKGDYEAPERFFLIPLLFTLIPAIFGLLLFGIGYEIYSLKRYYINKDRKFEDGIVIVHLVLFVVIFTLFAMVWFPPIYDSVSCYFQVDPFDKASVNHMSLEEMCERRYPFYQMNNLLIVVALDIWLFLSLIFLLMLFGIIMITFVIISSCVTWLKNKVLGNCIKAKEIYEDSVMKNV